MAIAASVTVIAINILIIITFVYFRVMRVLYFGANKWKMRNVASRAQVCVDILICANR